MRGIYGHVDGSPDNSFNISFICDGKTVLELNMGSKDFAVPFDEIDLTNVQVFEISGETNSRREYALIIELIPID